MVETRNIPVDHVSTSVMADRSEDTFLPIQDYSSYRRYGEDSFEVQIGGTTYEVSTHFSKNGRQSVMKQFKKLILSEQLI